MTGGADALVVSVRFLDGRYHGEPEWPPAPARLFQALVAAAAQGERLPEQDSAALRWLEQTSPPTVVAPRASAGQRVKLWVPNNDLDAKGGDPAAVSTIRTGKTVQPRLFDARSPLLYAWELADEADADAAARICELAEGLYQLGRGVDVAWATASIMDRESLTRVLSERPSEIFRPTPGPTGDSLVLPCPQPGSLSSLVTRFAESLHRFTTFGSGRKAIELFQQPAKASFARVAYDKRASRTVFDVHPVAGAMTALSATPLDRAGTFTEALRDAAAVRLIAALPENETAVVRTLVGRRLEGTPAISPETRVRIIPLPSIGHQHADSGIRRFLVEVPSASPLSEGDVFWSFSGLTLRSPAGVEVVATRAIDPRMAERYGSSRRTSATTWRSVTAVALPVGRRRIEPARQYAEAKPASERLQEEGQARGAVVEALRHAGVLTRVESVRVQREPFSGKGVRAEAFAPGTRFEKERLWHVEIKFRAPVTGPLVIGDGRFLGLGVMAPVHEAPDVFAFRIEEGLAESAASADVVRALRGATMARYRQVADDVPPFISGHRRDGTPAREGSHLFFAHDSHAGRLLVVPPHSAEHRQVERRERRALTLLAQALDGFTDLTAGAAGRLRLEAEPVDVEVDPLFAPACQWVSETPYVVNRHVDLQDAAAALANDVRDACVGAGLPTPSVRVLEAWGERGVGLSGRVELEFEVAVAGPLMLGRTRHKGGGLFRHAPKAGGL